MAAFLRRTRASSLLIVIVLGAWRSASAEGCDNCPQRRIGSYDFDVTVPRPDSLADLADWYSLFFGASAAGAAISGPQCAQIIDGSFYRDTSGVPSNSLQVGIDHPNTAPAGNLKGMDYLLDGHVDPDGSGYKVTLSLECACDRKTVVTASSHFDRADQASTVAGELARQNLTPIADVLRSYEKGVRAADPEVSIGGYDAKLVVDPIRRKVAIHETVPVTLSLTDCDGEPLAGRKISLQGGGESAAPTSSNGTFAMSEATTGSDGKVTVDFLVGGAPGAAMARAYFVHKTPFGCKAVAVDEAALEVGGSAAFYQVKYKYRQFQLWKSRYDEQYTPTWTTATRRTHSRVLAFSGSTVLRNSANALFDGAVELEGAGEDGGPLTGSFLETIRFTGREDYSDEIATITSRNFEDRNSTGGPYRDSVDMPDFYVSLDPAQLGESSQFSLTVPFASTGAVHGEGYQIIRASGKTFDSSWTTDEALSERTTYSPGEMMTLLYSLRDSVFHIDAVLDTSWSSTDPNIVTEVHSIFAATVSPVAKRLEPDAILRDFPKGWSDGDRMRLRDHGASMAFRLDDVAPGTRVRVELYAPGGERLATLHDAPRSGWGDLVLDLSPVHGTARTGLSILVLRAGSLRAGRVLAPPPNF